MLLPRYETEDIILSINMSNRSLPPGLRIHQYVSIMTTCHWTKFCRDTDSPEPMPPYIQQKASSSKAKQNGGILQGGDPDDAQESESGPTSRTKTVLTEEQKKANHIQSEQKRREKIREQYDKLAELTPGMEGQGRSEGRVLEEAVKHAIVMKNERAKLIREIEARGGTVSTELKDY